MNKKIKMVVEKSYLMLKKISPNIKQNFSAEIKIKGTKSKFDSVDIVTFFSFLEKNLLNSKIKHQNFLDKNFFFKFDNISLKTLIKSIQKENEKKN